LTGTRGALRLAFSAVLPGRPFEFKRGGVRSDEPLVD
jgi:hypothetical protein